MTFKDIQIELDSVLETCEIVRMNLREHSTFAVEMQYKLIVNAIALGEYHNVPDVIEHLLQHDDIDPICKGEITNSVKDLLLVANRFEQMQNTQVNDVKEIVRQCHAFADTISFWLCDGVYV